MSTRWAMPVHCHAAPFVNLRYVEQIMQLRMSRLCELYPVCAALCCTARCGNTIKVLAKRVFNTAESCSVLQQMTPCCLRKIVLSSSAPEPSKQVSRRRACILTHLRQLGPVFSWMSSHRAARPCLIVAAACIQGHQPDRERQSDG